MALTNAERKRRYIQNLKAKGLYDSFLKRKAENSRAKRKTVKTGLTEIGKIMREQILKEQRNKCRKRVAECRQRKKINHMANAQSGQNDDDYKTPSAKSKAFAKVKKTMPSTLAKQVTIVSKLFHSFDENVQLQIVQKKPTIRPPNAISQDLVEKVWSFYERDDISRISPNVKDARYFVDKSGKKELRQIRHLMYKLSEVYALFIIEYGDGESVPDKAPLQLSKFCDLRPKHVKLVKEMPHNVCYCLYHTNFFECCKSLHRSIPVFPLYGPETMNFLLCENPTKDCWMRNCQLCTAKDIITKVEQLFKSSNGEPTPKVNWIMWKKDEAKNRYVKTSVSGSTDNLIGHFNSIVDKFIKHVHIKRAQAESFELDRKQIEKIANSGTAIVHTDFAENWTCMSQDEIQSAHWNQGLVSLFTIALKYHNAKLSKAFVSDNTDHSKFTIVAYLYKIILQLPEGTKLLKLWSDGPSSQFKNKFIAAVIILFESLFPIKLIWNFFATSHGKGSVDGIGAVVKNKVNRMVMSRKAIVNNANDFVSAFNTEKSLIEVTEVTRQEIQDINAELELDFVFQTSETIAGISSFHQLQVIDGKLVGFNTSKEGYEYLQRK